MIDNIHKVMYNGCSWAFKEGCRDLHMNWKHTRVVNNVWEIKSSFEYINGGIMLNQNFCTLHSRTLTSTHGRVHSCLPKRLRIHSNPTPVHSSGLDSIPLGENRCWTPSNAAPAKTLAVEFIVSKTNSVRPSPGIVASDVALPDMT